MPSRRPELLLELQTQLEPLPELQTQQERHRLRIRVVLFFIHGIKSHILLIEPLPSLTKSYGMIIKQERKLLSKQVSGQNQGQSSKNSFRGEVNKFGVTADQLKNLMAYFQSQSMVNATHSNGSMSDQGNSTVAIVTPGNNSTQSGLQSKFLPLQNITDEGKFVSVVSVNRIVNNSSSSTWIIDTGATDHIVSSLHYYDSYRPVNDATVKLPNGTTLVVDHIGDIQLSASILLKDVLHVSSFGLNLISAREEWMQDGWHS
nr:Integrase, catalytic core [Ipomoea batatas]